MSFKCLQWWEYDPRLLCSQSFVAYTCFHFPFLPNCLFSVSHVQRTLVFWAKELLAGNAQIPLVQLDLFVIIGVYLGYNAYIFALYTLVSWCSSPSRNFIEHYWLCVYLCKQNFVWNVCQRMAGIHSDFPTKVFTGQYRQLFVMCVFWRPKCKQFDEKESICCFWRF